MPERTFTDEQLFKLKVEFDQSLGLESRNTRKRLWREGKLYVRNWLQLIMEGIGTI